MAALPRVGLSLRAKMILGSAAAVTLPCLVVGSILVRVLSGSLLQIYEQRSVQVAKDMAALVETALRQELYFMTTLSFDPVIVEGAESGNYTETARKLRAIHGGIPSPNFTYLVADRQGIVRADAAFEDSVGLDVSDRPYFRNGREGQASIFGPMQARMMPESERRSEIIVMISAPIRGRGGFAGIIAEAIRINHFAQVVSSTRIGTTGYAFLVNAVGLPFVHPDESIILKNDLLDDPGTKRLVARMVRGETGSEPYLFRGSHRIAGFCPIPTTGWTAAFSQDRAEILAPIRTALVPVVLGGCFLVAMAVAFAALMSRRITTPVERTIDVLQRITAQSTDLILSIGVDRRIRFANPVAERIYGSGSGGAVGMQPALTNSQDLPAEEIWKALEAGRTWSGQLLLPGSRPGPSTFTAMILPVRDSSGSIQSYIEIAKDVTNELVMEDRLRQVQKMEALGSIAGGIAHDFNNILAGIYGFAELSLSVSGNPRETTDYLHEIIQAAEFARDLTQQVLTFSRQADFQLQPVAPRKVVAEALRLMRVSSPLSIEVRENLASDSIIMAEPTHVHQMVVNLFTNAVVAIGDRAGHVEVSLEDREVNEDWARLHPGLRPGPHVLMRVSDSGAGIDPSIIDRIFDPFFTTKAPGKGTGLGLSVVHGIVSKLNGSISVRSEVGKGTTFDILIPVVKGAHAQSGNAHEVLPRGSETVLLVDDEQPVVRVLGTRLADLGYRVRAFTCGPEALAAFVAEPGAFDLLVTDNSMPGMSGIELARRIRARRAGLPVLLCSGFLSAEAEARATAASLELLAKPISVYQLAAAIRRVLDKPPRP